MPNTQSNYGLQGLFVQRGTSIAFIGNVDSVSVNDGVSLVDSMQGWGVSTAGYTGTRPCEVAFTARGLSPTAIAIITGENLTDTDGAANTATITSLKGDWSAADTELTVGAISEVGLYLLEVLANNTLHTTKILALDENIVLTPEAVVDTGDSAFLISNFNNTDRSAGDYYSRGFSNINSDIYIIFGSLIDPDVARPPFVYQWQRANQANNPRFVNIEDETNSSYTITAADDGKLLRAKVSYTDAEGNDEVVYTAIENMTRGTGGRINPPLPLPMTFAGIPGVNISVAGVEVGDKAVVEVMPESTERGTLAMGSAQARPYFSLYAVSDSREEEAQTAILQVPRVKIGGFPLPLAANSELSHELTGIAAHSDSIDGYYRLSLISRG